jgi:hypothetical protein
MQLVTDCTNLTVVERNQASISVDKLTSGVKASFRSWAWWQSLGCRPFLLQRPIQLAR